MRAASKVAPSRLTRIRSGSGAERLVPHLVALAVYGALAILYTWPVAQDVDGRLLGPPGDNLGGMHTLWWDWFSVANASYPWSMDLYAFPFTQVVFHPSPLMEALSLPITALFGATVASNVVVIASFALTGYGCFLLVRKLTGSVPAGIACGAFFTGTGAHQFDLLFNTNATFALPLLWLSLVLWREQPARWPLVALAGSALALSNFYFAAYFLPPTLLVFAPWRKLRERRVVVTFLSAVGVILVVTAGMYLPPLLAAPEGTRDSLASTAALEGSRPPTELAAVVIGSPEHPYMGEAFDSLASRFDEAQAPNQGSAYAGLVVLALAGVGWRAGRRTGPWAILAVVGFILMLGPKLQIAGHRLIPLPYEIYAHIPVLSYLRAPGRMYSVMELGLVVLAGFGLLALASRARRLGPVVVVLVALLGLFDLWFRFPQPTTRTDVPSVYERLARLSGRTAVIESPGGWFNDYQWLAYQRVSEAPLVNNAAPRPSTESNSLLSGNAFLLGTVAGPSPSLLGQDQKEFEETGRRNPTRVEGARQLAALGVGYAILHKQTIFAWPGPDVPGYPEHRRFLERYLGPPVYDDLDVTVFAFPNAPGREVFSATEIEGARAGRAGRPGSRGGSG